jgi:hypothetical protein
MNGDYKLTGNNLLSLREIMKMLRVAASNMAK